MGRVNLPQFSVWASLTNLSQKVKNKGHLKFIVT